jgi:hypothetical protein
LLIGWRHKLAFYETIKDDNLVKSRSAPFYFAGGGLLLRWLFEVNSNGYTPSLPLCGIDGFF